MDLIDKQNTVSILFQLFQQRLKAFLKITAIFGASQQRADIQGVKGAISHDFRHITLDDTPGEPFSNGGFTDTRLSHQQRVVFSATAQYLNGALQLFVPANERINSAHSGKLVKVSREVLHTVLPASLLFVIWLIPRVRRLTGFVFARAMRNKIHHIKTTYFMLTQQISRLRFLLAEDSDQHICAGNFITPGGLNMKDRALQYTLKTQRWLRVAFFLTGRQYRCGLFNEGFEFLTERHQIHRTRFQRFAGRRVTEQRQ